MPDIPEKVQQKLNILPKSPGVYFHKDKNDNIIYVGKAAVLRNRVRQYFQKSRFRDPKTEALVREIADIDFMVVDSEMEALFLESEMIKRYKPTYNILLRDDKSLTYVRIDYSSDYPTVSVTKNPQDDGAQYFGPYYSATSIKQALRYLRRVFPYATKTYRGSTRVTLHYHLGLDPGLEEHKTDLVEYRANLRKLISILKGNKKAVLTQLEKDMSKYSKAMEFEKAAKTRNQLYALKAIDNKVIFSDKEFLDISKDHALNELVSLLGLSGFPKRIEGYDISHMQGSDVVASMVVFNNGVSDKAEYRKFKVYQENNDFKNMHNALSRRLSEKNIKAWGKPNLVLIDGGKGQLDAAIRARDETGNSTIPFIGLAKQEEQIVIKIDQSNVELNEDYLNKMHGFMHKSEDYILVNVPHSSNLVKLLQRIRDESHRFAVSYHTVLKRKRGVSSRLDDISGIGPKTKKKLLLKFGSVEGIKAANQSEIVDLIGEKLATKLRSEL